MKLNGRSVLVVDDEPILSATFGVLLERDGATVHIAANGSIALQLLQSQTVDLILCDQQMPVMDGITLLRTLREQGVRIPVVLFVNGIDHSHEAEYPSLSVRATLTKPIRPSALTAVLEQVLAGAA